MRYNDISPAVFDVKQHVHLLNCDVVKDLSRI